MTSSVLPVVQVSFIAQSNSSEKLHHGNAESRAAPRFTVRVPGTARDHVARINHRRVITLGRYRWQGSLLGAGSRQ